ncbi:hypothetical protein BCR41DRAFT_1482 [Lobosporangium transversale]|uniref:Stress response protein NST1 n=1 Tax=Lobosporangium transversale TaxID=64571 RepID=A0A1Y2H277_9FUNG|nr:hypothetical protein BCR41DRAFT_1482 [Lobosporangium transversale]ORZ28657.1 hypothetical protein BCR41DRAFT_1482 [Lobosporangium transversale]|eukprot:XP_021886330.1 hypothetical protein BCR41DRAFT_1482 [Lobosporangium transversale]
MMDRLADRKVQRDDELMDNRGVYEEFDDDEDGDFEDDGVEEDALTKEQRMEEGRRMFQAFAARMFEQRVLSAYREKVAQERQERLLAELEEESRQEQLREERKEREKERKRDKKRLQRQQKEEERAAKEALRLAEEKRLLEERERKLEADRKRREEERRAKEEEKRLREEERLKKEEERKRKIKEEKAREIEKERKRKEEQHAKEQEELVRKAELEAQKVAEEAVKEAKRLEQEVYLKQQLAEEQKRQQELRQKEQKVKEDLEKLEWETASAAAAGKEVAVTEEIVAAVLENSSHDLAPESITTSISLNRDGTTVSRSGIASVTHGSQSRSPTMPLSTSPLHAEESLINQSQPAQGPSTSLANSLWSNPYSAQSISQPQLQPMFASTMQQGLFRPPGHFGPISGDLDPFSSRMGYTTGRGGYMGASHQNASTFQSEPQHHLSSNQLPQQMGGLRSPGLNSIGFGQINVPSKQLLTLMNPNSAPGSHELTNSNGSPLHSPPALGAIGTPIGSFGPISPIGHTRRTSTPYGTSSGDVIKPIQRPVPIGRPKDSQTHSHMSSSFDGISLGLSGLTIGSELDRRPRSPSLNLAGGSALDLDGIALGKDALRPTGDGADHPSLHAFGNENGSIQTLSSSDRNQRESSFFSNSFFGSRMNGHDPFLASDFSSFGHQLQSHGSLPNASHFMPPYSMHIPTSPHNQQQHLQHQQQLFMQQQFMHPNLQDLQPQQLGLSPPPLNGSNTWSRTNFMRPPHMNGPGGTVVNSSGNGSSSNIGLMSSTSRAHSPPPVLGGSLHNGSGGAGGLHSPLLPIGPPNGPSSHLQQQQQQQQHQYGHFPSNGANGSLGLTVGSGRKSVSHLPPLRHGSLSSDASSNNSSGSANSNSTGLVMENDRLSNGFRGAGAGYTSHHIQQ